MQNSNCPASKALIITEKVSIRTPVLYTAIIQHDLVEEKEFRDMSEFINQAVKEKLVSLGFNLEVIKIPPGWFEGNEKGGYAVTPVREKIIPYKKRRMYN
jgi:hypothetical protein